MRSVVLEKTNPRATESHDADASVAGPSGEHIIIVTCQQGGESTDIVVASLPRAVLDAALIRAGAVSTLPNSGGFEHIVTAVTAFMERAVPTLKPAMTQRGAMLAKAKAFIDAHLEDEDLSPEMIASGIFVSKRYLHILFKDEGQSVTRYVITRRLSLSVQRLRDQRLSHQSIGEIASRLGFKDPSHFARAFKTEYGVTPSLYRSRPLHLLRSSGIAPIAA